MDPQRLWHDAETSTADLLMNKFTTRTAAEWLETLHGAGVPVSEITACNEQWNSELMQKAGLIVLQHHYDSGELMPRVGSLVRSILRRLKRWFALNHSSPATDPVRRSPSSIIQESSAFCRTYKRSSSGGGVQ